MTDPQIPYTPPAEPAAPAAAEPAAPAEPTDYSAHPVWGRAIEGIPEILREPLYETIRESEREAQAAIEKARNAGVPEEWRGLYEEAKGLGLSVDDLARAYQGQTALAELMQSDPDGFVNELSTQIDQMVASGQLTRAQGNQAKQEAAAAASEVTDDLLTPEQKQLRELQAWKEQQEQAAEQARQTQLQQQQAEQIRQQEEAASNAYFDAFDQAMEQTGFLTRDPADGLLKSTIPVPTLQLIARTGAELLDANPRMPRDQAISQATEQVRKMIEATGGKLGPAPRPTTPVIGASSSVPTGQPAGQPTGPRTMQERMQAALAEATRQQAAG
jgi:hypothetical protein